MSLPWKSELSLRLSRSGCRARLARPWSRRLQAQVRTEGAPAHSLVDALAALKHRSKTELPPRARLWVADEYLHLALRPARRDWALALHDAREHFEQVLGVGDCVVQVAQLPMGDFWLAAALRRDDLDTWRTVAASRGVTFESVEPALLDDLRTVAPQVGERAVLALLREEGVSLVRIDGGVPVELAWERCEPHAPRCVEHRMLAFQKAAGARAPDPLAMLCDTDLQADVWRPQAQAYGWTLLQARAPLPDPWTPAAA